MLHEPCFLSGEIRCRVVAIAKTNGALIANKLGTVEVFEYETGKKNRVFLKNGFRQSSFTNADEWTSIKDTVEVISVEIVYSKYPIRGGVYNEIYPLLFNRIKTTIAMDPDLNNNAVNWVKVQQTNCIDNTQVDGLFHGVVIHYKLKEPEIEIIEAEVELVETSKERETRLERLNRERDQIKKEEEQFEEYIKKQNANSIEIYLQELETKIRENHLLLKKIENIIEKYK